MSGFGVLYYTDCRPGQGLNGSAGFQFQAASLGLASRAMPLVQRSALYEPPAAWMRDRRPAAEYPRSLTHTAGDGIYATAAGCYLGQEANGSRQGNQFTHAVVTGTAESYEFLRPAQLWDAPWWATEPAPGTELDELPSGPEGGPLDTESVRDHLRDTPGGEQELIALLSAVERLADPETRQTVVLVSADPQWAACWIAGATLLLPQPRALGISFKIFVADPQYGRHDIVALHPQWAGRWGDTTAAQGLAVFDLDRRRHSRVEPTDSARFWVRRFLAADDPLDVVDAIELAAAIATGDTPSAAERWVATVVATGELLSGSEQLQQVSTWLVAAPDDAAEQVREPLVDAVLAAGPGSEVLRNLAQAIGGREWGTVQGTVRRGLLRAELADALAAKDGVSAAIDAFDMAALPAYAHDASAAGEVETALRATRRPDQVPALLAVASRHGVRPDPTAYRARADDFARWWASQVASHRTAGLLTALSGTPEALDWVVDVLRYELHSSDPGRARRWILDGWWQPLLPVAHDPADPLHAEIVQVAYRELAGSERAALIRRVQDDALAQSAGDPDEAAWRMLFGPYSVPTSEACDFLTAWLERAPRPSAATSGRLVRILADEHDATKDALWLTDRLTALGITVPPRNQKLHEAEKRITNAVEALGDPRPSVTIEKIAQSLNQCPPELLAGELDRVVRALVDAPGPNVAVGVLRHCDLPVLGRIFDAILEIPRQGPGRFWPRDLTAVTDAEVGVLVMSFRVVRARKRFDRAAVRPVDELQYRLEILIGNTDRKELKRVTKLFPPDVRRTWEDWSDELKPGMVKKLLGSRGHSGTAQRSEETQRPEKAERPEKAPREERGRG